MIDLDINPPDDGMLDKLKSALARQLLPKILENMKNTVQQAVDGIVESEGQAVDNDYSTRFEINDRESTGIVTIVLGPISGPFDTVVQAHNRTTKIMDWMPMGILVLHLTKIKFHHIHDIMRENDLFSCPMVVG